MAHPVWGVWWGGSSYTPPTHEDVERFESRQDALDTFRWRYDANGKIAILTRYVGRPNSPVLMPAVDRQATMDLWPTFPDDLSVPVWRITFGPQGGVRITGPGVREVHQEVTR